MFLPRIQKPRSILWLLFGINLVNFFDRQIFAAVTEPVRREWGLTDSQLGWLVTAFTLLYALVGLPLGRLADTWRRGLLLTAGLATWSVLTFLSGLSRTYWALFGARLGVGIGEAACAPAASSLIGDLYRPAERARAMSIFMLGLPTGVALSYVAGGAVAQHWGWRAAFYLAGIPGLLLAGILLFMTEPLRGMADAITAGSGHRPGPPIRLILSIPTMRWIIASGLLHNFVMYALTFFLPAFLVRYHQASLQVAGLVSALVIGGVGAVGMLVGGWLGDLVRAMRPDGRLLLAGPAVLAAAPAGLSALLLPQGALLPFMVLQGIAAFLMYTYYATIYATIHDIVEPGLRGRAMAIYFFAMYLLGASLGPVTLGWLSDFLAGQAAAVSGLAATGASGIPEVFRAEGLRRAMFLVPALGTLLSAVLFAGATSVRRDIRRMQAWLMETHGAESGPAAGSGDRC